MFLNTSEIANGKAVQRFRFQPILNGRVIEDEPSGTITIVSPDGQTTLVNAQDLSWDETDLCFTYDLNTTDTTVWIPSSNPLWPIDFWYKATITWTDADETDTYIDERLFTVVLNTWRCNVSAESIIGVDDTAAIFVDDPADWVPKINESVSMLYSSLASQRPAITPGMILNRQLLDEYVTYKTLALFWGRRAVEKDQYSENNLHIHYNGLAEEAFNKALQTAHVDRDASGIIDEEPSQKNVVWMLT